ncbi:hypothetical protein BK133_20970 [Paenibacillus sp. FSL H8-0548]|nr:hypothetical protein BK133_20970 [Paenibacillus sp. FSL H8-0548]
MCTLTNYRKVAPFADVGIDGVTAENLNDILIAIGEAYRNRFQFNPPFSITSRDNLQPVVQDWLDQNELT